MLPCWRIIINDQLARLCSFAQNRVKYFIKILTEFFKFFMNTLTIQGSTNKKKLTAHPGYIKEKLRPV
jgi:hypothetical protein